MNDVIHFSQRLEWLDNVMLEELAVRSFLHPATIFAGGNQTVQNDYFACRFEQGFVEFKKRLCEVTTEKTAATCQENGLAGKRCGGFLHATGNFINIAW